MQPFTISNIIKGSPAAIFPYFADLMEFGRVHPIIFNVEQGKDGGYIMHEKVYLLGFIKYQFQYPGWVASSIPNKEIVIMAEPPSNIKMTIHITLTDKGEGKTEIQEQVTVHASWIKAKVLKYFVLKTHPQIAKTIEKELTERH